MGNAKEELYQMLRIWQEKADSDPVDNFKYIDTLNELFFHADCRFTDYVQYEAEEGPFPVRLQNWLNNVSKEEDKKILFKILRHLVFFDKNQMRSLYLDAYRARVVPWITKNHFSVDELLKPDYRIRLLSILKKYHIRSITESFNVSFFKQVNSLLGLPKIQILGEDIQEATRQVENLFKKDGNVGLIIFEDMVGTGHQASKILAVISDLLVDEWRCLFVPLIIQENGLSLLKQSLNKIDVAPVLIVKNSNCIQEELNQDEPDGFKYIRSLIKKTKRKVVEQLHDLDDPPQNAFGYEGSGALIVTCHNTPNNTIPLIHHRAPDWNPLFRRIHHSKE